MRRWSQGESWCWLSIFHWNEFSKWLANVNLSWSIDFDDGVGHHFSPVSDPTGWSWDGEHDVKHVVWDLKISHQNAGPVVDIWVEVSLNEIFIFHSSFFESTSDIEKRISSSDFFLESNNHLLHHSGTWIITFENTMSKTVKNFSVWFILNLFKICCNTIFWSNFLEHSDAMLGSTTMLNTPKRSNTWTNSSKRVGKRWSSNSDSSGRWPLLTISMQDEELLHQLNNHLWNFKLAFHWVLEHHSQEVFHVAQVSLALDDWESSAYSEGVGSHDWHSSDEFDSWEFSLRWVLNIKILIQETGKPSDNTAQNRHWISICVESFVELIHLSLDVHLIHDSLLKFLELVVVALSSVKEDEADFNEGWFLSEFADIIASVVKFSSRFSLGDSGLAAWGVSESWIEVE